MQGPTGTQYLPATPHFFRYPTQFSFENHQLSRFLYYGVLPNISGKLSITGLPKIPELSEIHNIPRNNREYIREVFK